jgi:hypothetical protein
MKNRRSRSLFFWETKLDLSEKIGYFNQTMLYDHFPYCIKMYTVLY